MMLSFVRPVMMLCLFMAAAGAPASAAEKASPKTSAKAGAPKTLVGSWKGKFQVTTQDGANVSVDYVVRVTADNQVEVVQTSTSEVAADLQPVTSGATPASLNGTELLWKTSEAVQSPGVTGMLVKSCSLVLESNGRNATFKWDITKTTTNARKVETRETCQGSGLLSRSR